MSRTIRVDDEVFAELQSIAVPLVDTPNSTLRRLLGLDDPNSPGQDTPGTDRTPGREQTLAPLLADGRLSAGQPLIWRRRNLRQEHRAVVQADGMLRLEDGSTHKTPSSAATHLARNQQNGWKAWATEDGTLLKNLR